MYIIGYIQLQKSPDDVATFILIINTNEFITNIIINNIFFLITRFIVLKIATIDCRPVYNTIINGEKTNNQPDTTSGESLNS